MHPVVVRRRVEPLHRITGRRVRAEHECDRIEIDPQQRDRTHGFHGCTVTRNEQRMSRCGILIADLQIATAFIASTYEALHEVTAAALLATMRRQRALGRAPQQARVARNTAKRRPLQRGKRFESAQQSGKHAASIG